MHIFPGMKPADLAGLSVREYTSLLNYSTKIFLYENSMSGEYPFEHAEGYEYTLAEDFKQRAKTGF